MGHEQDAHHRTRLLVGDEGTDRLKRAHVAVFGLGGVGSYAFEALVRSGIGKILAVDADTVMASNLNRQLVALQDTLGRPKVEVARERALAINPSVQVDARRVFVYANNIDDLLNADLDYAIDAIDTLEPKISLLIALQQRSIKTVSCMGAARRLDPCGIQVADISHTQGCPLARRVRRALRTAGIGQGIQCVYSKGPIVPDRDESDTVPLKNGERRPFGSISYVPGLIGLTAAGIVIQHLVMSRMNQELSGP